jgi:hypothetical protein
MLLKGLRTLQGNYLIDIKAPLKAFVRVNFAEI